MLLLHKSFAAVGIDKMLRLLLLLSLSVLSCETSSQELLFRITDKNVQELGHSVSDEKFCQNLLQEISGGKNFDSVKVSIEAKTNMTVISKIRECLKGKTVRFEKNISSEAAGNSLLNGQLSALGGKKVTRIVNDKEYFSFYDGSTGEVNCTALKDTLKLNVKFESITLRLRSKMQTETVEAIRKCFSGKKVNLKEQFYSGAYSDSTHSMKNQLDKYFKKKE